MEDECITELYWKRDEQAVAESRSKYGAYCGTIADNILHSREDTEECLNDTWERAWNTIPPERPRRLGVYLGSLTRSIAIDRWRRDRAEKRGSGQAELCLDELSECIGEERPIEDSLALREALDSFLRAQSKKNRKIFLLRYWYMLPVTEVADRCGMTEGAAKMQLLRLRNKLKEHLEKEGVSI